MQWSVFTLFSVTRMEIALRQSGRAGGYDLSEAAHIACQLLRGLLIDPNFRRDIEEKYFSALEDQIEIRRVVDDLGALNLFFDQEEKLLIEAGLNRNLVEESISMLRQNIWSIEPASLDPPKIYERLRWLMHSTCRIRGDLARLQETKQLGQSLRRVAVGAVGIGLIGLNGSALAATVGISSFGSIMSATAGSALLGLATDVLKEVFRL